MVFQKLKLSMEICVTTTSTLDIVKSLVSKMNDFEFRYDTNINRLAYQEYKKTIERSVQPSPIRKLRGLGRS